ncbi:MAG: insulinase family protein, partial [Candidatus Solibacter sp.]
IEDTNRATPEDVRKFYQTYYTPSNAVIVLVGDFEPAKARDRIKHYFEGIPARPKAPETDLKEPERTQEKRESAPEAGIPAPVTIISWRVPPVTDADWFPLMCVGEVLGGNTAARLQNSLIKTAAIATVAQVGLENSAGPNLFVFQLMIAPGKDAAQAETLAYEEVDRIGREGVGEDEIQRVRTDSLRRHAFGLVPGNLRAQEFALSLISDGRLDSVNEWEKKVRSVTSEDLQRVTRRYLTPARRTVFLNTPGGKP